MKVSIRNLSEAKFDELKNLLPVTKLETNISEDGNNLIIFECYCIDINDGALFVFIKANSQKDVIPLMIGLNDYMNITIA